MQTFCELLSIAIAKIKNNILQLYIILTTTNHHASKQRGHKASLRLKLPEVSQATRAPNYFKFHMNEIGYHIIRHRQLREHSQLFLFQFANTEALARALDDPRINKIVKDAGFAPILRGEARQAESAHTVHVSNVHSNFFFSMIETDTNDPIICKVELLTQLKEDCEAVSDVYIIPKGNATFLPDSILVKFNTVDNALKWIKVDTCLKPATLFKKNKSMQKRINLDVCGVCRKRNCTKGGRKCDGIQRCAKCAYPGHTAANCTELEYCTHCVNTGHTSGSLKCKENQKYSREKRIAWQNNKNNAFNRQNATNQVPQDRPNQPN